LELWRGFLLMANATAFMSVGIMLVAACFTGGVDNVIQDNHHG
jgi:hypothetical protein